MLALAAVSPLLALVRPAEEVPTTPAARVVALRAGLSRVPRAREGELLSLLSLVWRSREGYRDRRTGDAALALVALLLEGGLSTLAKGPRGADPGALLLGLLEAAGRGQALLWAARRAAIAARGPQGETLLDSLPEDETTTDLEDLLDRRAALARLSQRDQELLLLDAQGASAAEIGAALGIEEKAAQKALDRARQRLEKS